MITTTMRSAMLAALCAGALAAPARAQWVRQHDQFYLQASHNWRFRDQYMAADRLFNAFDYGHAILYETLWTKPNAPVSVLEVKEYDHLTEHVLVHPPRVPLEEAAIEVRYAQLAPEAKLMFEWAHVLHRQLYDVLADARLSQAQKDAEVARLVAYYKTRPDIAFSSKPKSMKLMQEQPYSLAFRTKYPKFNGLIWAYHWMQVGLYEPLMVGRSPEERQSLVRATVARFWQMLEKPVEWMPHQMPMTAAISPRFTARYPEAAIIFDNLHSMHDVISDVLANPAVPRDRKRAEILIAAARFRDDTSYVMTEQAWRTMSEHMGVENMGGPSVGFLPALPTPTVTYGAVMTHDDRTGAMTGFKHGQALGGEHAGHGGAQAPAAGEHAAHAAPGVAPRDTGSHAMPGMPGMKEMPGMRGGMHDSTMMQMHMRMMADSVIRRRMLADTAMRRMMNAMMADMPAEHRAHMEAMMREGGEPAAEVSPHQHAAPAKAAATKRSTAAKSTARAATRRKSATTKPATKATTKPASKKAAPAKKPAPKPAAPHAGHHMPTN